MLTAEQAYEIRNSKEVTRWRYRVLERDKARCMICESDGPKLSSHHIKAVRNYPELATEDSNGILLCAHCHRLTFRQEENYEEIFTNLLFVIHGIVPVFDVKENRPFHEVPRCYRCGEEKPIEQFVKSKRAKMGYNHLCKECLYKYKKENYHKQRQKHGETVKRYQTENKEKYKRMNKDWYEKNKEHRKEYCRMWNLRRKRAKALADR